jgi:multiple sugar transport system permease protein
MHLSKQTRYDLRAWVFVFPVVAGTLIFNVAPIVPSIWLSFMNWTGLTKPYWLGFANYAELFQDKRFYETLGRTFSYMAGTVVLGYVSSLALALLVNRSILGIRGFRTLFFAPVVTSGVAVGMTWRWMLNTNFGVINSVLKSIGILGPRWLGDPPFAMLSVIVVAVWKGMGYGMIILLAGLQGIPDSLYDSADIDGASAFQKFRLITFPLLSPISFFVIVLSVIGAFRSFDMIFVMTGGGPGFATTVYMFSLWQEAFTFYRMGMAAAMGWILFLIVGAITVTQWKISEKWVFYR